MTLGEYLGITDKVFSLYFAHFYYYQNEQNTYLLDCNTYKVIDYDLVSNQSLTRQLKIPIIYSPINIIPTDNIINISIKYNNRVIYYEDINIYSLNSYVINRINCLVSIENFILKIDNNTIPL